MTIQRSWHPSPNYSGGLSPRMITLHTSEGAQTNQSLANFICQASAQVSYHASVDNVSVNFCYTYVNAHAGYKSWAQASYNPDAITICFCTPSGASSNWSRDYWLNTQYQAIKNAAAIAGEEARRYGIPFTALSNSQAQGSGRGFSQHLNLGAGGSGHHDCGGGFPMDELLRLASGGSVAAPEPTYWKDIRVGPIDGELNLPIPSDLKSDQFVVAADVGGQGYTEIKVRVALKHSADAGWTVKNFVLTPDKPNAWASTNGHNVVTAMVQTTGASVGYLFQ